MVIFADFFDLQLSKDVSFILKVVHRVFFSSSTIYYHAFLLISASSFKIALRLPEDYFLCFAPMRDSRFNV